MSGISAVLELSKKPVSSEVLERITQQVAYRGPDGIHYHIEGQIGLAALSLHSTPEAESEKQPVVSEDGRYAIVADTRIDNRRELLLELRNYLAADKVPSDAELILAAWKRWKTEAPGRLIGDFAFVIWDRHEAELFAARDPLGVCPLHYARFGDTFCIGSEAQQLLQHPACPRQLERQALAGWLLGSLSENTTLFRGINPLPAAHWLRVRGTRIQTARYWDIDPGKQIRYAKDSDYAEHFRELMARCVQDRMRSNSTIIGSEMSGGMDSTTVTSLAKAALSDRQRLQVLSLHYNTLTDCDESPYIKAMADHLGLDVDWIDAEANGALHYPESYATSLENPGTYFDPVHRALVDRLAASGARTLLTGNGGDELTWGNGLVYAHRFWRGDPGGVADLYRVCGYFGLSFWRQFRALFISPYLPRHAMRAYRRLRYGEPEVIPPWFSRKAALELGLFEPGRPHCPEFGNAPQRQMYLTLTQGSMRSVVDSCTLLCAPRGIAARHPFLDRRLAEFAFAIPPTLWTRGLYSKWLLRYATSELLPDSVRWRKEKTMFSSFYSHGIAQNGERYQRQLAELQQYTQGLVDGQRLSHWFRERYNYNPNQAAMSILLLLQVRNWLHDHQGELNITG